MQSLTVAAPATRAGNNHSSSTAAATRERTQGEGAAHLVAAELPLGVLVLLLVLLLPLLVLHAVLLGVLPALLRRTHIQGITAGCCWGNSGSGGGGLGGGLAACAAAAAAARCLCFRDGWFGLGLPRLLAEGRGRKVGGSGWQMPPPRVQTDFTTMGITADRTPLSSTQKRICASYRRCLEM